MITFTEGQNKFNFRVAGIAVHRDRILLHTTLQDDFWNLPGGRVEFQESTDQALIREIREELGIDIQIDKLLYVNEDFFEYDRMKYHEIGFSLHFLFPKAMKFWIGRASSQALRMAADLSSNGLQLRNYRACRYIRLS
uniref:NUDIX hydrolase n=1 Tax=Paenibacillus terrae TaxID=159743 RepID=UPI0021B61575|nr:NUDIX domain-containing protein [Paenibacillus terrae]